MNIALPALLIFLLALPGLIFNLTFFKIENTSLGSITNKTVCATSVTLILHLLALFFIVSVLHISLSWQPLLILISGIPNNTSPSTITSITVQQFIFATIYLLVIYVIAYLFGSLLRALIVRYKWDKRPFFQIDSPWYYLFKGYVWRDGTPDWVQIAAMIEVAGKGYLYVGVLEKFFLDNHGNIDRLILTSAMRREIKNDKNKIENAEDKSLDVVDRFYDIDGHYFVLRYSEIKNLNVQFFKIDEIPKNENS